MPAGAAELGAPVLRDVGPDRLAETERLLDRETFRQIRHIVTENQRVLGTVAVLDADGPHAIGSLLSASHVSKRDDFGISCCGFDAAVDAAQDAGALAARMTRGGFGGSGLALVATGDTRAVAAPVRRRFLTDGYRATDIIAVHLGPGACRIDGG